jgi:hypothetical protein
MSAKTENDHLVDELQARVTVGLANRTAAMDIQCSVHRENENPPAFAKITVGYRLPEDAVHTTLVVAKNPAGGWLISAHDGKQLRLTNMDESEHAFDGLVDVVLRPKQN